MSAPILDTRLNPEDEGFLANVAHNRALVEALRAKVAEAALGGDTVLWLTDRKGRRVGVPATRIAYVELGTPTNDRIVGFGAA